jgi:hypothetical protein
MGIILRFVFTLLCRWKAAAAGMRMANSIAEAGQTFKLREHDPGDARQMIRL